MNGNQGTNKITSQSLLILESLDITYNDMQKLNYYLRGFKIHVLDSHLKVLYVSNFTKVRNYLAQCTAIELWSSRFQNLNIFTEIWKCCLHLIWPFYPGYNELILGCMWACLYALITSTWEHLRQQNISLEPSNDTSTSSKWTFDALWSEADSTELIQTAATDLQRSLNEPGLNRKNIT